MTTDPNSPQHKVISISLQSVLMILGIFLVLAAAFVLRDLLLVVFAAVIIAAAIEPTIQWFRRQKIPRIFAVIIIYLIIAAVFVGVIAFLMRPLVGQATEFLNSLPEYWQSLQTWVSVQLGGGAPAEGAAADVLTVQELSRELRDALSDVPGGALSLVSKVFGGVLSFILIVVLSFYLSVKEHGVADFLRVVTPARHEAYILGLWARAERKIGLWLQGQLLLGVIIGVITFVGLSILGVEHALLLAVLAGTFELIPLLGPVLAAIPAILIAFTTEGLVLAALVTGLYVIVQQLESHVIYPLVVKKMIGLSPVVMIIALVAGGQLAGFLGILLSVPVAAILMEVLHDVQAEKERRAAISDASGSTKQETDI
ncbi:MAG: AI-2E family transporter [Candidatus Paceibacterota bacterium]